MELLGIMRNVLNNIHEILMKIKEKIKKYRICLYKIKYIYAKSSISTLLKFVYKYISAVNVALFKH